MFNVADMIPCLTDITPFAEFLGDEARKILLEQVHAPFRTEFKADRSFVTSLDLRIEAHLRDLIRVHYPEHGILGEEAGGERLDAEWVWVLDPIDGTAPFVAGIPVYGTLIALAHDGRPCLGVMDFPATDDRWVGVSGKPTLHNARPCTTRKGIALDAAIQCTMNPDFFSSKEKQGLEALKAQTAWRIYGGSAFSYGRLASGSIDIAFDTRLKAHDYAAFVPILEGAGGMITDWQGRPLVLSSGTQVLAAGDPVLHQEALQLLSGLV